MPDTWMSVAEAAAFLKVHTRTIERRIAAGKLDTRRANDGQIQISLDVPEKLEPGPDPLTTVTEQFTEQLSVVTEQAESQVQLALSASTAMVKQSQRDATMARQETDRAWMETERARRSAHWAWSIVGAAAVISVAALTWSAHSVTKTMMEKDQLSTRVGQLSADAGRSDFDREVLRRQLADARESEARSAGRAEALFEQSNKVIIANPPATQPAIAISPTTSPSKGLWTKLANVSDLLSK